MPNDPKRTGSAYRAQYVNYNAIEKKLTLDFDIEGNVQDYIFYPIINVSKEIAMANDKKAKVVNHLNAILIFFSKVSNDTGGVLNPSNVGKLTKTIELTKLSDSEIVDAPDFKTDDVESEDTFIILYHDNTFRKSDIDLVYDNLQEYYDDAKSDDFVFRPIQPKNKVKKHGGPDLIPRKAGMTIIRKPNKEN